MSESPAAFEPYIPATETRPELTFRALLLGSLFGILFGAVTVYVGLRAGLTVAASIPILVLWIERAAGAGAGFHSGKQHRSDDRQRGAMDCFGRDFHFAGADFSGL